jgi:hypothetical protein
MLFPAQFNLSDLDGSNGFVINGIDEFDRSGGSLGRLLATATKLKQRRSRFPAHSNHQNQGLQNPRMIFSEKVRPAHLLRKNHPLNQQYPKSLCIA